MRPRPRKASSTRALIVLALLAPACVKAPTPRVGVRPVSADLVFGIPSISEPVGPPNTGEGITQPIDIFGSIKSKPIPPGPTFKPELCPVAETKSVRSEATPTISFLPTVAKYKWKVRGVSKLAGTNSKFTLPLFESQPRELKNVVKDAANPGDYTYETVQFDYLQGAQVTTTWHVIRQQIATNPLDPNAKTDSPAQGLYLKKQVRLKAGSSTEFNPQPEVLFLKLPANPGRFGFGNSYVDNVTFETWRLKGVILGDKKSFDACGEDIDTKFVDGTLQIIGGENSATINYDFGIATQYGGFLVGEQVQRGGCTTSDVNDPSDPTDGTTCKPKDDPLTDIYYTSNIGSIPSDGTESP